MSVHRIHAASSPRALRKTIKLIGNAINDGASYVPLRQYAASLASRAGPKDFLGQVKQIYDDFTRNRWRYVYDPIGVELLATTGPVIYDTIFGFGQQAPSKGFGDCDDSTVGLGAAIQAIGLPIRTVTIAKPGSKQLFDHVFPQVKIPRKGWISLDAVGYPRKPMGWTPPHSRIAIWDTAGNLRGVKGNFPGPIKTAFKEMSAPSGFGSAEQEDTMSLAGTSFQQFQDYGLENFGLAGIDSDAPEDWSTSGFIGFGSYIDQPLPMMGGDQIGLMMEYDDDDTIDGAGQIVRTKMLEMDPKELAYTYRTGRPRLGALAVSDDGDFYQWTEVEGLGGFFKKLFRRARKAVGRGLKRIHRGISKVTKKLIKKLPGGKYLVKVYDKVKRIAMKAVKPLVKILGKIGKKIAPIAALIPGYGPVIAAGLHKAGKITKLLDDYGILTDTKGRPKFKSGKQAKQFTRALKRAARKQRRVDARHVRSGRLLKRGSPRHRAKLRGYGLEGI